MFGTIPLVSIEHAAIFSWKFIFRKIVKVRLQVGLQMLWALIYLHNLFFVDENDVRVDDGTLPEFLNKLGVDGFQVIYTSCLGQLIIFSHVET